MKRILGCLLVIVMAVFLTGYSGHTKVNATESYQPPFIVKEIDSKIILLNDSASDIQPKGIQYQILLLSTKNIQPENYSSYKFEIVTDSILKENLGPIQGLNLMNTTNEGYLYNLSFETVYRNYAEADLEILSKDYNFQILVDYKGRQYPIEVQ